MKELILSELSFPSGPCDHAQRPSREELLMSFSFVGSPSQESAGTSEYRCSCGKSVHSITSPEWLASDVQSGGYQLVRRISTDEHPCID